MDEFFANIWNAIMSLAWSDWLTIAILIAFLVLGYKRGMAKELINSAFLLLAIIVAYLFYQPLATSGIITWLLLSHQSHMAIAFGVLFIGLLILKNLLYRFTATSSAIGNPCALNRLFAWLILLGVGALISWYYLDLVANLGIMEIVITNESARIAGAFVIIFALLIGACISLSNIFNISIDTSKSCLLSSFYQAILNQLKALDGALNARNVSSTKNALLGSAIGLIKGSIALLIMVLVLQNISWIAEQDYWNNTQGALKAFQDVASDIKPALSQHLEFIRPE